MILAFYWGIGFALVAVFLKTPRARHTVESFALDTWQQGMTPLLMSSVIMMGFAVLAARVAFALPRDLRANWIFRVTSFRGGRSLLAARPRVFLAAAVMPVWVVAAAVFFSLWPWREAAAHLAVLALLGLSLVEICLAGTRKIPFTCSYLPGKSRVHVSVYVFAVLLLPLTTAAVESERAALSEPGRMFWILATLGLVWTVARWHASGASTGAELEPEFEDEPSDRIVTLDVWDSPTTTSLPRPTIVRGE
jgi:hypothetical protein